VFPEVEAWLKQGRTYPERMNFKINEDLLKLKIWGSEHCS
jgi:hypothetical protein